VSPGRSPVADLLAALGAALGAAGARWYLFGAQAALLYGAARLTADVDVTVDLGAGSLRDLLVALRRARFTPRVEAAEAFAERHRVIPLVHEPSGIAVDVVLAGSGLEETFFEHARERVVEGVRVPVASPGDLVVMKVLAGRPKDLEDAAAIVAAGSAELDLKLTREILVQLESALDRRDLVALLDGVIAQARRA
jgi:hypothetical protein